MRQRHTPTRLSHVSSGTTLCVQKINQPPADRADELVGGGRLRLKFNEAEMHEAGRKVDSRTSNDEQRRWCLFTSAGDKNAIRLWLAGDTPRRWDLVAAYYGDDDDEFATISELCSYAFRTKGGKFQNLKKLITEHPQFFDRYSHVWVCDDDIVMSRPQINEAFDITERLGFWVAQPADRREGRNSHWITCFAGPSWDYRIVNFVEVRMPIFRRDKLIEFLAVYDGSLVGAGIEYWFANLFKADEFGRFAIIDKVQVINPRTRDKGESEIDRLQAWHLRYASMLKAAKKYGFAEDRPHKVFAYCKLAPPRNLLVIFELPLKELPMISPAWLEALRRSRWRGAVWVVKSALIFRAVVQTFQRAGWRQAIWFLRCGLVIRRQRWTVNDL